MRRLTVLVIGLCLALLIGATVGAAPNQSVTVTFFEGFDDDIAAGRTVPDLVDPTLSSPFGEGTGLLSFTRSGPHGYLLDFINGHGSFVTFRFSPRCIVGVGSTISFNVLQYGSDGGSLSKFVSSNGVTFTQVGDTSDAMGAHTFNLTPGVMIASKLPNMIGIKIPTLDNAASWNEDELVTPNRSRGAAHVRSGDTIYDQRYVS